MGSSSRLYLSTGNTRSKFSRIDVAVYGTILFLGAIQFFSYLRAPDYVNDAMYGDLAQSLLQKHSYEFDFRPETMLPPGFPLILALTSSIFGLRVCSFFHVIAICFALGLIATYELLRRLEGRVIAAGTCLLLASSPEVFAFNTQLVFSDTPFFCFSMLVLLLARKLDRSESSRSIWVLPLTVLLILAVLIRSIGIVLPVAAATWIAASLLMSGGRDWRRFKLFVPALAIGFAGHACWSRWAEHRQHLEWQLPGWPQSYISQLRAKNGNRPELGLAHLKDLPGRVAENVVAYSAELGSILTHKSIFPFWTSPVVISVIFLVTVGLWGGFQNGGELHDWYFLWYVAIYLFWPWDVELRFVYPITPLVALYIYRGSKVCLRHLVEQPRRNTALLGIIALVMTVGSAALAAQTWPLHIRQPAAATLVWAISAILAFCAFRFHARLRSHDTAWFNHIGAEKAARFRIALIVGVAFVIVYGSAAEICIAHENLTFDLTEQTFYPEIEAAQWIRMHEPPDRVVMARKQDLVFHYSQHRVIWFPPSSNPDFLIDGIRRHHVTLVVVAHHEKSYWQPAEDICFRSLVQSGKVTFHVVHHGPNNLVFELAGADSNVGTAITGG